MDRPAWAFVESLWQLQAPEGETLRMTRQGPLAVDVARNEVVRAFLQQDSEWLLMVDSDATLHPQTLLRLLSWNQPVVGALSFQRYGPCMPTVMRGQVNDTARLAAGPLRHAGRRDSGVGPGTPDDGAERPGAA